MGIGRRKTSTDNLGKWVWDARAGKSYTEDRVYSERDGWNSEQHPIENDKFRAAFDMANLQVGWIAYLKGEGLNAKLVPVGEDYGDPPSDKYKEGLRLLMKMDASLGGEVRESVSTWLMVWAAIDALHDEYLAGVANHAGKLPVVDIADTQRRDNQGRHLSRPGFQDRWLAAAPARAAGFRHPTCPAREEGQGRQQRRRQLRAAAIDRHGRRDTVLVEGARARAAATSGSHAPFCFV
jgi:hypothetical protein